MKQNPAVLGLTVVHPSRTMVVTFIQPIPEQKSATRHYTTLESYFPTLAIFSLQKGKKGATLNYFLPMFLSESGIIARHRSLSILQKGNNKLVKTLEYVCHTKLQAG
ncbi:hypothetical protein AVEN_165224-1 [Araneus ventricosus]|uniref:Uncharacterized protein n=1 Tax=Araneus ventricosus TaxID=182803 RepID=A0A4Y2B8L3_ARAVE|nr:hypothetical protein AVEN_165224-1 [Araneus ventricosus]